MDSNLDATRLNPYGTLPGQNKRETLPPLPSEPPVSQMYGPSQSMGPYAAGGYPSATGYPSTTGYQAPTPYAGMGYPTTMPPFSGTYSGAPGVGAQPGLTPLTPFNQPIPVTTENILYLNAFLRTMIGRRVTVDFLIGTNTLTDRTGTLLAVGANYIVINEVETDDLLVCDFYSIKFVKIYY